MTKAQAKQQSARYDCRPAKSRQENQEPAEEGRPGYAFFAETVVDETLQDGIQARIGAIGNDADHLGVGRHEQADSGSHRKAMQRQFAR